MPKKSQRKLTEAKFYLALSGLRVTADNIELAKLCMVHGAEISKIATENQKSKQALSRVIKRIWDNREVSR